MKVLSNAMVAVMLLGGAACSSGLSHVIPASQVAGLDGTYAENIDAARTDVTTAEDALSEAKKAMKLARAEEARAAYQAALLAEREAAVEMAESELWVKKAKFELVKLEMLIKSKGLKDVKTTEQLLEFKTQLSEREQTFLDSQRDHASKKADREEKRADLNQKLRESGLDEVEDPDKPPEEPVAPPPPAPTVTPDPVTPDPGTGDGSPTP